MIAFVRALFDLITSEMVIFDNVIIDFFVMAFIGFVAFILAKVSVGSLYYEGMIGGRFLGSLLHWMIRLVFFFLIYLCLNVVSFLVKVVCEIPLWFWIVFTILIIIGIVVSVMRKYSGNN